MSRNYVRLPDLVISPGNVDSNIITAKGLPANPDPNHMATDGFGFRDADDLQIEAPADLIETVNLMVAADELAPRWSQAQDAQQNPIVMKPGQSARLDNAGIGAIKLTCPGGVVAVRTFQVGKTVT